MTTPISDSPFSLPLLVHDDDKSSPLKNRIRKNYQHLRKWGKRTVTNCFRIYDKDIKAYPLQVDFYAGNFFLQSFSEDRNLDEPRADLKTAIELTLRELFNAAPEKIYWRVRIKRKRVEQYEKIADARKFFTVYEYGTQFKVNLNDYLDTGLFLDRRETRQLVAALAKGKRLLNLFAYTCAFSVQSAMAGAAYTKSVDLSNTYCEWGTQNFLLNFLSLDNNEIIRADCLKFIYDEIATGSKYDVIVIDPPTVSRSKKMEKIFDIQLDYVKLLLKALELLSPEGLVIFSTNSRRFKFDIAPFRHCLIKEITEKTIPLDFHDQKVHRCWSLRAL